MKGEHSIWLLCEVLGVARSGYYRWKAAPLTPRKREDAHLLARIAVHHRKSRGNYGSPRIVADLREEGLATSRRRCARLMNEQGLRGKKKHRRKPRTTDSRHSQPVAPNVLALVERPTAPNQVWVTDITYIQTDEGWLYLAVILDIWSRRVVGWACAATMASTLVLAALQDALKRRGPVPGLMHHSDRGSQYVDHEYVKELEAAGIARSMSRPGNCYDNAAMESFWSNLKTETGFDINPPQNRREAKLAIFDHIETFYNPWRRHSSLGYLSPVAFELKYSKTDRQVA
jgi:putative transposase